MSPNVVGLPVQVANFITDAMLRMDAIAEDDCTRVHLTGVYLNFEKREACATNGKGLVVQRFEMDAVDAAKLAENRIKSIIVAPEFFKALRKVKAKDRARVSLTISLRSIELELCGQRQSFMNFPGDYPDYGFVIPRPDRAEFVIGLNPRILADLAVAMGEGLTGPTSGIRLHIPTRPTDPIRVTFGAGDTHAVLMPMRMPVMGPTDGYCEAFSSDTAKRA